MIVDNIETPRFVLSCLDARHASDTYLSWMVQPEITQFLESRFAPHTHESLLRFIMNARSSHDTVLFGIFDKATQAHLGNVKIGPISNEHATASIGIIIGEAHVWGTGVASETIRAVSDWAFSELKLAKLTAGSYKSNPGSIRAFEKSGYDIEGVQRSQVRLDTGERDDVMILGLLPAETLPQ